MSTQPNPEQDAPNPKVSERFCDPKADITLRSTDGVLFRFYKKQLGAHSAVFADAGKLASESPASEETIDMTVNAAVLDIFLQFMALQRPPDLANTSFDVLAPLAEAVAKYDVFCAMPACEIQMECAISEHPLEVLEYAAKHGHGHIMDTAAWASISVGLDKVTKHLSSRTLVAWLKYMQFWLDAESFAHTAVNPRFHSESYHGQCDCREWATAVGLIATRLGSRLPFLQELDKVFPKECSAHIRGSINVWKEKVSTRVASIPKFSTLL